MEVGDLVWYYPAYGPSKTLCVISKPHDIYGLLFVVYEFERGFEFVVSKSCIKKLKFFLDKTKPIR